METNKQKVPEERSDVNRDWTTPSPSQLYRTVRPSEVTNDCLRVYELNSEDPIGYVKPLSALSQFYRKIEAREYDPTLGDEKYLADDPVERANYPVFFRPLSGGEQNPHRDLTLCEKPKAPTVDDSPSSSPYQSLDEIAKKACGKLAAPAECERFNLPVVLRACQKVYFRAHNEGFKKGVKHGRETTG